MVVPAVDIVSDLVCVCPFRQCGRPLANSGTISEARPITQSGTVTLAPTVKHSLGAHSTQRSGRTGRAKLTQVGQTAASRMLRQIQELLQFGSGRPRRLATGRKPVNWALWRSCDLPGGLRLPNRP